MVAQIFECATKRVVKSGARTGDGAREKNTQEKKKVFESGKEIEDLFDEIFAQMYPGVAVDPESNEETTEMTRAYPYEFDGWREVGVNTRMCEQLCKMKKMALRVVRERALIHSFDPVSKEDTRAKALPVLVYNVFGDHAFFYETTESKNGVAHLSKRVPLIAKKPQSMSLRIDERFQEDNELFQSMEYFTCYGKIAFDPKCNQELET